MANRYAVATGNWSNTATWDGGTLPTAADDVFSNNFTVTINGTFTVLTIRNTSNTTPAIVAGGAFTFANGGDLTASNGIIPAGSCVIFDLPSPSAATLRASASLPQFVGGSILVQNTGTFNMVGNYDLQNTGQNSRRTIFVNGSPTINIIGNITNSQSQVASAATLWSNGGAPTINITGNITGGISFPAIANATTASTILATPAPSLTSASVASSTTPVALVVAACFKFVNAAEAVEAPVPPCAIAISVAAQVPVAIVPIAVMLVCEAVTNVPVIFPNLAA